MNANAFDTLQYANRLKAVGFSDEQAQVITDLQRAANDNVLAIARHDYHLDEIASKRDLSAMEATLRHDLTALEASLRHDLTALEASLRKDLTALETSLRHDLTALEASLRKDLTALETSLRHDLATLETNLQHDLTAMETKLRHEIELLRADTGRLIAETNQRIAESKADLTRWIIGAGFLQSSLIIAVLLKIAHLI